MMCRVGMTTDPKGRRKYWETQEPTLTNWKIIHEGLTYDQAQALEIQLAGQHECEQDEGGPRVPGNVWSVYYFEF